MVSGLYMHSKFYNDEGSNDVTNLELKTSAMTCFSFSSLPLLGKVSSSYSVPLSDETRNHKRIKKEFVGSKENLCTFGGGRSRSTNSLHSFQRLNFRDHIWACTQRYLAVEAMEAAAALMDGTDEDKINEEDSDDGTRLVQLLTACAEAVACRDKSHASTFLSELQADALVFGTPFQRVASCFVQGLADRLALVQPLGAVGISNATGKSMAISLEKEEALNLFYDICPQIQFGHFVANAAILEAFERESSVHVVDLGMTLGLRLGHQWRQFMHSLANREGQLPRLLRITGIGNCEKHLKIIGRELKQYADGLGLNFEFSAVESTLDNLQPENIKILDGEVLVINSILELHCIVKESRGALNSVLRKLHKLLPKVLILVEQDSSHNGPFFLGRFMEALHYYSAVFDSLDAMLPKYDTRRAKMEQFYFAEEIKNIVSREGPARVERHERLDQWRRRMSRAGFQALPIKVLTQAKQWLGKIQACEGYTIAEEKGCMVLGWKNKPIVAASCWKCS